MLHLGGKFEGDDYRKNSPLKKGPADRLSRFPPDGGVLAYHRIEKPLIGRRKEDIKDIA